MSSARSKIRRKLDHLPPRYVRPSVNGIAGQVECLRVRAREDGFLDRLVAFCDRGVDRGRAIWECVLPDRPEHAAGVEALAGYSSRAAESDVFVAAGEPAITVVRIPGVVETCNETLDIVHL